MRDTTFILFDESQVLERSFLDIINCAVEYGERVTFWYQEELSFDISKRYLDSGVVEKIFTREEAYSDFLVTFTGEIYVTTVDNYISCITR